MEEEYQHADAFSNQINRTNYSSSSARRACKVPVGSERLRARHSRFHTSRRCGWTRRLELRTVELVGRSSAIFSSSGGREVIAVHGCGPRSVVPPGSSAAAATSVGAPTVSDPLEKTPSFSVRSSEDVVAQRINFVYLLFNIRKRLNIGKSMHR